MKFFISIFLLFTSAVHAMDYNKVAERSVDLLKAMVKAETVGANEERVVALIKKRLDSASIPYEITEFAKGRKNIVARLKGNGTQKPMLILAHSDVVPATGQPWTTPPHEMIEKEGYLYGRGVVDDLGYVAIATELLIEIKNEKTVLNRDIILAITGDEEKGGLGARYLIEHHRDSIDAEFALNEGAATLINDENQVLYVALSAAEKTYQDYALKAEGKAGHSSLPNTENAIYYLSGALDRLGKYKDPVNIIPSVAVELKVRAQLEKDPKLKAALLAVATHPKNPPKNAVALLEQDVLLNALIRSTCVATVVQGGTMAGKNVLPPSALANVNCRLLPGTSIDDNTKKLISVIHDPKVAIERDVITMGQAEASPLDNPVVKAATAVAKEMFKEAPLMPSLLTGATDSRHLRKIGIPSYGISPLVITREDRVRVHGANERLKKAMIPVGAEFFHRLIMNLAAQ